MNSKNKVIKSYLKNISAKLNCTRSMKSVFLNELKGDVETYTEAVPSVTKDDLYKEFGTPDEISNGLLDRNDYNILLKKAKRKAFTWKLIGIGSFTLFIFMICLVALLIEFYGGEATVTNIY